MREALGEADGARPRETEGITRRRRRALAHIDRQYAEEKGKTRVSYIPNTKRGPPLYMIGRPLWRTPCFLCAATHKTRDWTSGHNTLCLLFIFPSSSARLGIIRHSPPSPSIQEDFAAKSGNNARQKSIVPASLPSQQQVVNFFRSIISLF